MRIYIRGGLGLHYQAILVAMEPAAEMDPLTGVRVDQS